MTILCSKALCSIPIVDGIKNKLLIMVIKVHMIYSQFLSSIINEIIEWVPSFLGSKITTQEWCSWENLILHSCLLFGVWTFFF